MKFILLLLISSSSLANPNAVIYLDAHYDKYGALIEPDRVLLSKAINDFTHRYYQSAMMNYKKSAAFGNSTAQRTIGLMYIKALGVQRNWAKGYAWIRLAALDGSNENKSLKLTINKNLTKSEKEQSEIEYGILSKDYEVSQTLRRRDHWVKKKG